MSVIKPKYNLLPYTLVQVTDPSVFDDDILAKKVQNDGLCLVALWFSVDYCQDSMRFWVQRRNENSVSLSLDFLDFIIELDKKERLELGTLFDLLFDSPSPNISPAIESFINFALKMPVIDLLAMCVTGSSVYGAVPGTSHSSISHKKSAEFVKARDSFVENVISWKNQDAIALVIDQLPPSIKKQIIEEYLQHLTDNEVKAFYNKYINLEKAATESRVQIIVRERSKDEKLSGTDGRYRICYSYNNGPIEPFHFPYRADAVVYLCCLMERKGPKGNENIDFSLLRDTFIGAFKYLYGDDYMAAENAFNELFDKPGLAKLEAQGKMKDRVNNIRKVIDHHLLRKENTELFYFKKHSHLKLLSDNIILPDNIYKEVQRLSNKDQSVNKS